MKFDLLSFLLVERLFKVFNTKKKRKRGDQVPVPRLYTNAEFGKELTMKSTFSFNCWVPKRL